MVRTMRIRPSPIRSPTVPEVLLATGNPHKLEEVRAVLEPLGWSVLGLDELPGPPPEEPVEDGETFEANARIKARAYAAATEDMDVLTFGAPVMLKNLFDTETARARQAAEQAGTEAVLLHRRASALRPARASRGLSARCRSRRCSSSST